MDGSENEVRGQQVEVREATQEDNSELLDLQMRCPMGTTLKVSVVNAPDFFARAKAYEAYRVFVACEGRKIVGSAACAVRRGLVDGKIKRIAYEFQYMTSPDLRRKGVAQRLHRHIKDYVSGHGAALSYLLVMEGNVPSIKLFEGLGFKRHRNLVMPCILAFKEMEIGISGEVRPAGPDDLASVAELLNWTWHGYDLYEPISVDELAQFIERTPEYGLDNLLVLKNQGKIRACIGHWDWSRIATVTVQQVSRKLRALALFFRLARRFTPMPQGPRAGRILRQMALTPIGMEDPKYLTVLIRYVNNDALRRGIEQIFFICEEKHDILTCTKGLVRVNTCMHLYIKRFAHSLFVGDHPVFIDGIDL